MATRTADSVCFRLPIIVILGATGTGKSKLAIEIGKRFNGEIISADSMQLYKGLDIVTNKVTAAERLQVKHYLLDFLSPNQHCTVVDFRDRALPIIESLLKEKKPPIIVGGTNYYIESLLWKVLIQEFMPWTGSPLVDRSGRDPQRFDMDEFSVKRFCEEVANAVGAKRVKSDSGAKSVVVVVGSGDKVKGDGGKLTEDTCYDVTRLHAKLKEVDPEMAAALHPSNTRKIMRSLQVFSQTGRRHSELLKEQREAGGTNLGGPLRYPDSIIFWLKCEQDVLDKRLDDRVDEMIKTGLIDELLRFHEEYNKLRLKESQLPDYTKGIFQSIGFKEFHSYLLLSEKERNTAIGKQLFSAGVTNMKQATRRYARKQIKWIKNRFLRRPDRQVPPVYALDTTDVEAWDEKVMNPAFQVIESFMNSTPCDIQSVPREQQQANIPNASELVGEFYCETCDRVFIGSLQWQVHIKSNKHSRAVRRKEKEIEVQKAKERAQRFAESPSLSGSGAYVEQEIS